jgi:hypothetical protein
MTDSDKIKDLTKEELVRLCKVYAKNWLAHDGSWFLSIEEKYGMNIAVEMDIETWKKFTVIEAERLTKFLGLGKNSGVEGLKKALSFRLYSTINEDEIIIENDRTLKYYIKTCKVQESRRKKGLKDFHCKPVGIVEYSLFAKTIDQRFQIEVISCPPDITNPDYYCIWKFTLIDTNT